MKLQRSGMIMVIGLLLMYGVFFVGIFAFQYVQPAIELQYLETGAITSGLHLRSLWQRVSKDPVDYLLFFIYHYLTNFLGALGMFACYIGMFVTMPWAIFTDGALMGRYLAKQDQERREGKRSE